MGAPSGEAGVHAAPNALHSAGFFSPCNTSALMHSAGSVAVICPVPKISSASKAANSGRSR
jgi:hypothetical protein